MLTTDANKAFLPEETGGLVIQPVVENSIAAQVAAVHHTSAQVNYFRVPIVTGDPTASWVAEGDEITPTDANFDEAASAFFKLAGLTIASRELVEDSSPEAAEIIGTGLARDIARKLDVAYFGTKGSSVIQPAGLEDLTGVNPVAAGTSWANTDPFTEAIYEAEGSGASLHSFVANPADALLLAKVKKATGSNEPLLGNDPTEPSRRTIGGVPLRVSPAVSVGTVWGIPNALTLLAIREDVRLEVDRSAFFTSDQVAIKATMRVAMLFPHAAAVQKITLGA